MNSTCSISAVEYCTFRGSTIVHSVRCYQYCGAAKQPEEGGVWGTGGRALGVWMRGWDDEEQSPLPDSVTSTGAAQEEVVLALRHDDVGSLHGRQLGGVWGVSRGWGLCVWGGNQRVTTHCKVLEETLVTSSVKRTYQHPQFILWKPVPDKKKKRSHN